MITRKRGYRIVRDSAASLDCCNFRCVLIHLSDADKCVYEFLRRIETHFELVSERDCVQLPLNEKK